MSVRISKYSLGLVVDTSRALLEGTAQLTVEGLKEEHPREVLVLLNKGLLVTEVKLGGERVSFAQRLASFKDLPKLEVNEVCPNPPCGEPVFLEYL
mgnify:CR=1 FL=1